MRPSRRDENGFVAILAVICMSAFMFGCAAIGVDVARWYLEGQRAQSAADAAALGAVVFLPEQVAKAQSAAADLAQDNGFVNGTNGATVTAGPGDKPTQMKVTVCRTVNNAFGVVLGYGQTTVCRTALADYTGPQPMGSPCNTLGNEPAGTNNAPPAASQLKVPSPAVCSSTPQFWMHVSGPNVPKENGDQFDTRYCNTPTSSGCTGTTNAEFRPEGYFLLVRVAQTVVGKPVRIQLYDPEFAPTDDRCTTAPSGTFPPSANNWNAWTDTDGQTRYHVTGATESPNAFCTGDVYSNTSAAPTVTSYALRAPTDTQDPTKSVPVPGCTMQFPGYASSDYTIANLYRANNPGGYDNAFNESFHQWSSLCVFTPTVAGDYYLQVRTDVALGGAVNSNEGGYVPPSALTSPVYTQTGDDPTVTGGGANRYSVRAFVDGGATPAGGINVAAYGRMPIYTNANSTSAAFNLIRVLPAAAGKTMNFTFFDLGDAQASGTVTVQAPGDSNITGAPSGCKASGDITTLNGSLTGCSLSGINSGNANGKAETISVPIPSNYTCTYTSVGGCWFRVAINFPSGTVTDTTTWSASISGQPVRLLQ